MLLSLICMIFSHMSDLVEFLINLVLKRIHVFHKGELALKLFDRYKTYLDKISIFMQVQRKNRY